MAKAASKISPSLTNISVLQWLRLHQVDGVGRSNTSLSLASRSENMGQVPSMAFPSIMWQKGEERGN